MIEDIQRLIMVMALSILAILLVGVALRVAIHGVKCILKAFRQTWLKGFIVSMFVAGLAYYGGSKGTISFPYVDAEQRYLTDRGSFVTNDFIHIDFERIIAPSSAPLFGSYRPVSSTNDNDWITFLDTTFAEFSVPTNFPFAAATNFNFVIYTTWTPGPSVQTNGVWHANWGLDKKYQKHYIPIRTVIRCDGEIIATPKSKEDQK